MVGTGKQEREGHKSKDSEFHDMLRPAGNINMHMGDFKIETPASKNIWGDMGDYTGGIYVLFLVKGFEDFLSFEG